MKKVLLILVFLALAASVSSASAKKGARYIYLWDVTLSMSGVTFRSANQDRHYDPKANIYADVKQFLIQEIERIEDDGDSEIIVLPFRTQIDATWREKADRDGKNKLISLIGNYPIQEKSNTNITGPIDSVKREIIKPDRDNRLVLLTDGMQSSGFGGKGSLMSLIETWDEYAGENYAHCLYVMLGEARDNDVVDAITGMRHMSYVTEQIVLQPEPSVAINMKDDWGKPVVIEMKKKSDGPMPDNIRIRVVSEPNSYASVEDESTVRDGRISFGIDYSVDSLRAIPTEKFSIPLRLVLLNQEEIQNEGKTIVTINPNNPVLELINKPEKRLTISYE